MADQRPGKVALITGCNRGVGRGIAGAFQAAGYTVVGLNRTPCRSPGVLNVQCDLSAPEQIGPSLMSVALGGGVDTCVINAAVRRLGPLLEAKVEDWMLSLQTNLMGAFCLVKSVLPLLGQRRGTLIFIGSNSTIRPFEGGGAYVASKSGLDGLAKVTALEAERLGIRVLRVILGAVNNREAATSEFKLNPDSIGRLLVGLTGAAAEDVWVTDMHVEPRRAPQSPVTGIDRLLYRG